MSSSSPSSPDGMSIGMSIWLSMFPASILEFSQSSTSPTSFIFSAAIFFHWVVSRRLFFVPLDRHLSLVSSLSCYFQLPLFVLLSLSSLVLWIMQNHGGYFRHGEGYDPPSKAIGTTTNLLFLCSKGYLLSLSACFLHSLPGGVHSENRGRWFLWNPKRIPW